MYAIKSKIHHICARITFHWRRGFKWHHNRDQRKNCAQNGLIDGQLFVFISCCWGFVVVVVAVMLYNVWICKRYWTRYFLMWHENGRIASSQVKNDGCMADGDFFYSHTTCNSFRFGDFLPTLKHARNTYACEVGIDGTNYRVSQWVEFSCAKTPHRSWNTFNLNFSSRHEIEWQQQQQFATTTSKHVNNINRNFCRPIKKAILQYHLGIC